MGKRVTKWPEFDPNPNPIAQKSRHQAECGGYDVAALSLNCKII